MKHKSKSEQPKPAKIGKPYDGMGGESPAPGLYTPRPTIPKSGEVRGKGAATKGAYLSKNG